MSPPVFRRQPESPPSAPAAAGADGGALEALRLDGEGPVWMQIRRALARRITSGDWRPGTRIPGELDLTEHFSASRMTVNKAIQSLAGEGLVTRRRKVGTIVADRAQERPAFEIWDIQDIIGRAGGVYGYRLLDSSLVTDDSEKRDLFNVSRKTKLIWMRCVHLSGGTPFQLEERLINVDAAPGILSQPMDKLAPGPWLVAHVPWTQAEHTISARGAGPAESAALNLAVGAACLVVERRTWNGDVPVTLARLWHPGDQHRLKGTFEPMR